MTTFRLGDRVRIRRTIVAIDHYHPDGPRAAECPDTSVYRVVGTDEDRDVAAVQGDWWPGGPVQFVKLSQLEAVADAGPKAEVG